MVKALKVQMKSPTVQPVQPDPYRGLYSKYILQYPFTKIGWTGWTENLKLDFLYKKLKLKFF